MNIMNEGPLQKILSLLGPTAIASIPGIFVLFYYQIHIGNLPVFITQSNAIWIALSVSLTTTLFYAFMLTLGSISAFWLYACFVIFFQQWNKVSTLSGTGIFPWAKIAQIIASSRARTFTVVKNKDAGLLVGGVSIIVLALILTWLENYPLNHLFEQSVLSENIPVNTPSTPANISEPQLTQPSSSLSLFRALSGLTIIFLTNLLHSVVATSLWQKYRKKITYTDSLNIRNCLPASDRAWFFYMTIAFIISCAATLTKCFFLFNKIEFLYRISLICNLISAFLPIVVWRACHSLPRQHAPIIHNLFPDNKFLLSFYFIISIFISMLFLLFGLINATDHGFISLILYFYLSGFLLVVFVDSVHQEKIRTNLPFLLLFPVLFLLFHGSWSTLARESMSLTGFHTWRQNTIFVTEDLESEISGLLDVYGLNTRTCITTVSGKKMFKISVTIDNMYLPLQVLWNDGSDNRLLGFDTELIPQKNFGPTLFIPPVFTSSSNVKEFTAADLAPCTPE